MILCFFSLPLTLVNGYKDLMHNVALAKIGVTHFG